jgi:large subunit ribosomal protein L15
MQIHQITRKTKNKKRMTVARGGKRGKTAGRGTKGQKARAGHKIRPEMRDLIKKLPKMRGRGKNSNVSIQTKAVALSLGDLEVAFKNGDTITRQVLVEKGIISLYKGKLPQVKVIGNGDITKKLILKGFTTTASVKEKIEKAGGAIHE